MTCQPLLSPVLKKSVVRVGLAVMPVQVLIGPLRVVPVVPAAAMQRLRMAATSLRKPLVLTQINPPLSALSAR
jgi:hypothetical protein